MQLSRDPSSIAIDILNRNKELAREMVDFMADKGEIRPESKGTKGMFGWGMLLREFFDATSKDIPNADAMNNGIGLLLVQMEAHGYGVKLKIRDDEEAYVVCEAYRLVKKMVERKWTPGMGWKEKERYDL